MTTGISWTDETWNVTRGCDYLSAGCKNCYAAPAAARVNRQFAALGRPQPYEGLVQITEKGPRWTGETRFVAEKLVEPLRWRKPKRIFVNSMSDLFHDDFTNEQIALVYAVMALAEDHTFQVLTKRPGRRRAWFTWIADRAVSAGRTVVGEILAIVREQASAFVDGAERVWGWIRDHDPYGSVYDRTVRREWPLSNAWEGVSVENQKCADERIPLLCETPAAVRFLSMEPLLEHTILGEVALRGKFIECPDENQGDEVDPCAGCPAVPNDGAKSGDYCGAIRGPRIDWVIAGCESGPGARPCDVAWLRSIRDQCAEARVPFFLKQAYWSLGRIHKGNGSKQKRDGLIDLPYLDGEQYKEFPR